MAEAEHDYSRHIEEIDKQLMAIQLSTRTVFKLFQPFHEKARERWRWYYRWHVKPGTNKVHWTIFGVCNVLAIIGIMSAILSPANITKATSETTALSNNSNFITLKIPNGAITADKLVGSDITTVGTITSGVWNGTDIAWVKINKSNSSLADLTTRSAGDLNSGILSESLLPNNVTKLGNSFNNASQLVQLNAFGYLPAINGAALTNLSKSQVGLTNVENTALSTWTGSTNIASLGTVNTGTWQGMAIADSYIYSSSNWNSAYAHIADINNPHSVTANQVLPDQLGQSGKILGTDGTNVFWANDINSVAWGTITGTLSAQSDLSAALFGKEPVLASGTISQYYRGDKTWAALDKGTVGLSSVEDTALSTWVGSTNITNLGTINTGSWNGSNIAWSKIDKTGSSLADLATRSAGDLTSGTLSDSRLSSNVTLLGNATTGTGNLVRSNSPTITDNLDINAHIKSTQTTAPTISAPLRCGTAGYSASVAAGSTDLAGSFTISAGTGTPRDTCDTIITFNTAYNTAPKAVMVSPGNCSNAANCSAHKELNVSAVTTTSFGVKMNNNPTASEVNTWYYWVIE